VDWLAVPHITKVAEIGRSGLKYKKINGVGTLKKNSGAGK